MVPHSPQRHNLFLVALCISLQLLAPECAISVRYATPWTVLVMMPEAAMHKNCLPPSLVGDIGGSRKTSYVPPIPRADRPYHLADRIFRGGPLSSHPFHERGPASSGLDPGHTLGQIFSTALSRRSRSSLACKYSEYASWAPWSEHPTPLEGRWPRARHSLDDPLPVGLLSDVARVSDRSESARTPEMYPRINSRTTWAAGRCSMRQASANARRNSSESRILNATFLRAMP